MSDWNLQDIFEELHNDIERKLNGVRKTMGHSGDKGDASESVWLKLLKNYLPKRYQAEKAHVVDSNNKFSDQIDAVVFDRQYSPLIFKYQGKMVVPAESVYAVFETKQTMNLEYINYAREKIESVRNLYRTSLPIPYVEGEYKAKPLHHILGGILTIDSDWSPKLGDSLIKALSDNLSNDRLDLGCAAAHGYFIYDAKTGIYSIESGGKPSAAFLLKLIAQLQCCATVPRIDISAYEKWLTK